ncbi:MAG: hypothetical protein E7447_00210 [Ruminococcaceae bacterium]|nr:hypothetical protein [Oscillospiraceae bacterium]
MNKSNLFFTALDILWDVASNASPKDTHGPIVKTGPTAGQNRSRNKNGQWRKKRSDTGKPRI